MVHLKTFGGWGEGEVRGGRVSGGDGGRFVHVCEEHLLLCAEGAAGPHGACESGGDELDRGREHPSGKGGEYI